MPREGGRAPAYLYVAVPVHLAQSVDYSTLAQMGFQFHHFRPAELSTSASPAGGTGTQKQEHSARSAAEFVYTDAPNAPEVSKSVAGIVIESDFDNGPLEAAAWKQRAADRWKKLFFGEA